MDTILKTREDSGIDVALVGYENQENLGLRSIMAYLREAGCSVVLLPFAPGNDEAILMAVRRHNPRLVGFSLIFQYSLDEFGSLMRYLRMNRVAAHFTAGGHFPSLRPEETLDLIPELDSIVRFEGEATLFELFEHIEHPQQWVHIQGLAFRNGRETVISEPRPLISDLDSLPLLYRDTPQEVAGSIKMAAMLSSRGCLFNCSFCSIRQFYGASRGSLRRTRSPGAVVDEMCHLHSEKNVTYFSFQDDDFAARSPAQKEWVKSFLKELRTTGLADKIAWKISCRVDDLDSERLMTMKDHGLLAVYLGVESGNSTGLHTLNKHVSVAQNLAAVELLKKHDMAMAIGFMLFDPSSTIESISQNINFLKVVGEDGYFPINFCKMLPYAGTPIEAKLRDQGRLKGTLTQPDYSFDDPVLEWYEFFVQQVFQRRNFSPDGIVALLQQADFDWRLTTHFQPTESMSDFGTTLNRIVGQTNMAAIKTLESLLDCVLNNDVDFLLKNKEQLVNLFETEWREEMKAEVHLKKLYVSNCN
jgi:radical SAM superfamily enzyme YgiQ (UPF0313 family)